MHVLRLVRVLVPLAIAVLVVAAGSSLLSARPDLENARRKVDAAWGALAPRLDARYELLASAQGRVQGLGGPVGTIAGEVDGALARWRDARAHGPVAAQVAAANDLEALGRRLAAAAEASPRVRGNAPAGQALVVYLGDTTRDAAATFDRSVTSYQHERRGPIRAVVASVLGDGAIPVLDTTRVPTT